MDDRKDNPDPAPDAGKTDDLQQRGPAGDARPSPDATDPRTRGGQPQENVNDRGNVGQVSPDDYPEDQRRDSRPDS